MSTITNIYTGTTANDNTGTTARDAGQIINDNFDNLNADKLEQSDIDSQFGNVDNTSDADKPVSTATQSALNSKVSFPEAPEDGKQYARKDAGWEEVTGGSGGGAVDSVNGETGDVVLDTSDIDATTDKNYITDVEQTKLTGIEDNADVTDSTNVDAAGAVMESDYSPAHSVLVQQSGTGSPSSVSIGNNEILGRQTGGGANIEGLSASDIRSIINVEDGAEANLAFGTTSGTVLEGDKDALYAKKGEANIFTQDQIIDSALYLDNAAYVDPTTATLNRSLFNQWTESSGQYKRNLDISVRGSTGGGVGGSQIRFWTNGVDGVLENAMLIDRNGNVGIGTTSPISPLHVKSTGSSEIITETTELGSYSRATYRFRTTTNDSQIGLRATSAVDIPNAMYVYHGNNFRQVWLENGNVGIGTISPGSKLTVDGGDIEILDSDRGVILKSPDNTRFILKVNNAGELYTTEL